MSRKRKALLGAAGLAVLGLISSANAGTYTEPGGPIPDNAPANPLVVSFNVIDPGSVVSVDLTLSGLVHTWAGDIIATLEAPGGTTADIMRRPTEPTAPTSGVGDSSNFGGTYRFIDGGADLGVALAGGASAFVVPSGDYAASTRNVGVTANTPVVLNTTFGGLTAAGVWTLRISDNASLDTGALNSATLNVVVPEPTTLGLAGIASLGLLRRRRA